MALLKHSFFWVISLCAMTGNTQSFPVTLKGELYCVSNTFSLTRVEVEGSNSKLLPVPTESSPLRPPRPDLHPSYNSLLIEDGDKRTLFVPDSNVLRVIELNSQTVDNILLPSCDPLLLRRFEAVPNETWVLCNPDGASSTVNLYKLVGGGEKGWTAETPLTIDSGTGSLLKDVGFVFSRNNEVYVVVATPTQVVWFTPRTNVRVMQSIPKCVKLLQIAEFSENSLVFECGQANDSNRVVRATLLYDLGAAKDNGRVLDQDRTSGKIIFSEDKRIISSVSSDRIAMELLEDGVPKQMVPLISVPSNDIHDAFIETENDKYTLVYSRSGGGVYSYNITAALDGNHVEPQMITEEETVCGEDCVGLLSLGNGFFAVGLSEPEGVGWYSISPPRKIGFASGAPSARLAFSPAMDDPGVGVHPEELEGEGLSGGGVAGIAVAGSIILLFIAVVAIVLAVVLNWNRK